MSIIIFFFLDEKETKSQGNSPTTIYPVVASRNGGSLRIAKISRTITNVCGSVKKAHFYIKACK